MLPNFGPSGRRVFDPFRSGRAGCAGGVVQRSRGFVPDRAVRSLLVVVSTPSLQLFAGVFGPQEPVSIEALCAELAVEAFDERVVSGLAWAREVERDVVLIRPQIEIAGDKLRALIDSDPLGIAGLRLASQDLA